MNLSSNSTLEACLQTPAFTRRTKYIVVLSLIDIVPFLLAAPDRQSCLGHPQIHEDHGHLKLESGAH